MREILFRGKRVDNGKWVEGFYCKHDTVMVCFTADDPKTKHLIITDGFCDWGFEPPLRGVEVDPATVGQYTGLRDKNGKRIFEGDVLRITDRFGMFVDWRVKFRKSAFSVKHPDCNYWCGIGEFDGYTMEIIGNIHDNPELLEKEAGK